MGNDQSDRVEEKCWKVVKWIPIVGPLYWIPRKIIYFIKESKEPEIWDKFRWFPIVNIGYGFFRCIYYFKKGETKMAVESAVVVFAGIIGIAVGFFGLGSIAACGLSELLSPTVIALIHSLVDVMVGGTIQNVVIGGGDMYFMKKFDSKIYNELTNDEYESLLYEKVIKDLPVVGIFYSFIRSVVYAIKGDSNKSIESLWGALENIIGSLIAVLGGTIGHLFIPGACDATFTRLDDDIARGAGGAFQKFLLLKLELFVQWLSSAIGAVFKYLTKCSGDLFIDFSKKTKYI